MSLFCMHLAFDEFLKTLRSDDKVVGLAAYSAIAGPDEDVEKRISEICNTFDGNFTRVGFRSGALLVRKHFGALVESIMSRIPDSSGYFFVLARCGKDRDPEALFREIEWRSNKRQEVSERHVTIHTDT